MPKSPGSGLEQTSYVLMSDRFPHVSRAESCNLASPVVSHTKGCGQVAAAGDRGTVAALLKERAVRQDFLLACFLSHAVKHC
jgi:hypothetical protein